MENKTTKQNECKHNFQTKRKRDKKMLNGWNDWEVCKKCNMERHKMRMQIILALKYIAKDNHKKIEEVTPDEVIKSGFITNTDGSQISLEIAKELIKNKYKFI